MSLLLRALRKLWKLWTFCNNHNRNRTSCSALSTTVRPIVHCSVWVISENKSLELHEKPEHRIGRRDSATCPHCNGADETAEHLVLRCQAHDQARRDIWLGGLFNTDP